MTQPPEDPLRKQPGGDTSGYPPPPGSYPPPNAYPPPQGSYPPPGSFPPPAGPGYPPPGQYGQPEQYGQGGFPPPPAGYGPGGFPPPMGPPSMQMPPELSVGSAISYGWSKFSENAVSWILVALVATAVNLVISFVLGIAGASGSLAFSLVRLLVSVVLALVINLVNQRGAFAELDGRRPGVGDFFSIPNFGIVLVVAIAVSVASAIGFVLLIIPGIVIGYLLVFATAFAMDRQEGLGASISQSVRLAGQNVGKVLPLLIVCLLLNVVGVLLCFIGSLVTIPVSAIALAYAYRVLTGGVVSPSGSQVV